MSDAFYPRLCGGVFFTLLVACRKQRTSARENLKGKSDGLSEPKMLADLIRVADPTYSDAYANSFKNNTSRYKNCQLSSGTYLPFKDTGFVEQVDTEMRTGYNRILVRMHEFLEQYVQFPRARSLAPNILVSELLNIIAGDESIDDNEKFLVRSGGNALTKAELSSINRVSFQPFLLGVWHYIIVNRPDNTIGVETLAALRASSNEKPYLRGLIKPVLDIIEVRPHVHGQASGMDPAVPLSGHKEYDYSSYMRRIYEKYKSLKTLLYNDVPHDFYEFYVPSGVYIDRDFPIGGELWHVFALHNPTALRLSDRYSRYIIITGTGGLGKSMMMRHLLLEAIDNFNETLRVPIFVSLKDYSPKCSSLFDYIFERVHIFCDVLKEQLRDTLVNGEALILLDGLDEVKTDNLPDFHNQLDDFIDTYSDNMFIMSSRPFQDFTSYHRFTTVRLMPFSKAQALQLVDNLEFRPDEPSIKEQFKKLLDSTLYDSHREFANNPLLLTIMLMTFEQYAEIPSKMHLFYREAFLTLAQKHDASKGAYKRTLNTGLSADRLSDYLAEFCMRTYYGEKFELTYEEFNNTFNQLRELKRVPEEKVTANQFLLDLLHNLCLIYFEDRTYHFVHRSFQEYFCALFFSKQKDRTLLGVGQFFENRAKHLADDKTFSMLYDMIPDKVNEYIFVPMLEDYIKQWDSEKGYWTYLVQMHPIIGYDVDEVLYTSRNTPSSFIIRFIVVNILGNLQLDSDDLPFYDEFIEKVFVNVVDKQGKSFLLEDVEADDPEDFTEISDPAGYNMEINLAELFSDNENMKLYDDLISAMNADSFPLKREYLSLKAFYEKIKNDITPSTDNFLDMFG